MILFAAPAAFGSTEWWSLAAIESLIFVLSAMCLLRRDVHIFGRGELLGFGAISLLGIAQLVVSRQVSDPVGLLPFTVSRPQTLYALGWWLALIALWWSAYSVLRWDGAVLRLTRVIFAVALFISLVGLYQRGQVSGTFYGLRPIRHGYPFGPFTNYNHAATWLTAAAFIGLGLLIEGVCQRGRGYFSEYVAKLVLFAFSLLIVLAAVVETGSRGAINSFWGALFLTGYLFYRSVRSVALGRFVRIGLAGAIGCFGLFIYFNSKWIGLINGVYEPSTAYRLSMYRSGLRMIADNPIFGVGLGGFANAFHAYQEPLIVGFVDHIHSSWLEIAVEAGLWGVCGLGMAVLPPVIALAREGFKNGIKPIAVGCFAAVVSFLLHGCVEFSFQIPADAILFMVLLALAAAQVNSTIKAAVSPYQKPRVALTAVSLVLAILSLLPGFDGYGLRLGAPFSSADDRLLASSKSTASELARDFESLAGNPLHPSLRHRFGVGLLKSGRVADAGAFLSHSGPTK